MVAMNEWKKKCVGLQRTWVSKRTVYCTELNRKLFEREYARQNMRKRVTQQPMQDGSNNAQIYFSFWKTNEWFSHWRIKIYWKINNNETYLISLKRVPNFSQKGVFAYHISTYWFLSQFFLNKCTGIRFLKYWSRGVGFQLPNSSLLMISGTPRKHYVYGGQIQRPGHICLSWFATAAAESHMFLKAADYIVWATACNSNFIYRAQTMPGSFFQVTQGPMVQH